MPTYHLASLGRQEYIDSIQTIKDPKSSGFAQMSLEWWDRHFNWKTDGCIVLCDADETHLSYIFYIIDRYREYLSIHNIFTPLEHRRNGYAKTLLEQVFESSNTLHVRRCRLTCVSQSLDFYLALGFVYWGLTSARDYYCDLPMPKAGLDDLSRMTGAASVTELLGSQKERIIAKVHDHELELSPQQQARYDKDTEKMQEHYLLDALRKIA